MTIIIINNCLLSFIKMFIQFKVEISVWFVTNRWMSLSLLIFTRKNVECNTPLTYVTLQTFIDTINCRCVWFSLRFSIWWHIWCTNLWYLWKREEKRIHWIRTWINLMKIKSINISCSCYLPELIYTYDMHTHCDSDFFFIGTSDIRRIYAKNLC